MSLTPRLIIPLIDSRFSNVSWIFTMDEGVTGLTVPSVNCTNTPVSLISWVLWIMIAVGSMVDVFTTSENVSCRTPESISSE